MNQGMPENLWESETEAEQSASVSSFEAAKSITKSRIPESYGGIQYNFCKNPKCVNYGIPPSDDKKARSGVYSIVGGGKGYPLLKCQACGEAPPIKSNKGIVEEIERLSAYLNPKTYSCPDSACENHTVPLGTKKAYRSFGMTKSGSARYQCAKCKSTFSIPKPANWQHETSDNKTIFKMLVNKVPFSRIVSMLDIEWQTLYRRIDFIHSQCMAFAANREQKLKDLPIERLYLSIDRQDHLVNWSNRKDKRNVMLSAITSADNLIGYVFGMHSNFDYLLDREAIEREASFNGDNFTASAYREFARLWLEADYLESAKKVKPEYRITGSGMDAFIQAKYNSLTSREDIENFDHKDKDQKLPDYGMQIHSEYTMIAHFYFLKNLMGNVEKWRFFMDQESGIRAACLSAFQPEIAKHEAEAFYVKINKGTTQEDKMALASPRQSLQPLQ